jgi:tripartite-type tricarboxylate transporter receptor subunit TctC
MRQHSVVAAFAVLLAAMGGVAAQTYPSRPITLVVAFAAGGSGDTIARILADHMRTQIGQTIVVENVGGAAGSIGVGRVARSVPDGYTIVAGNWPTHVLNGAIYSLNYDVLKDFEPISLIATESIVIVGRKDLPAASLTDLIAWLRANPDKASAGTVGPGSVGHIVGLFFQKETGTRFQFIPYRGVGPAIQDMIAGQIDIMFDTSANSLPQVRSGNVKAFAVTSKTRPPAARHPDSRRGRLARIPHLELARPVGAKRHTARGDREAQRRGEERARRCRRAQAARRPWPGAVPARSAHARGAWQAAGCRDREMVADHQGCEHQGAVVFE